MPAKGLPQPPAQFDRLALVGVDVAPERLLRIGWKPRPGATGSSMALAFRRTPEYRFDAPAGQFGVAYAALELSTAFAESVLRDRPQSLPGGQSPVFEYAEFDQREVLRLGPGTVSRSLRLVQLWDVGLAAAHVDNRIATDDDYTWTRGWALAFHAHTQRFDGIAYLSRFMGAEIAVALFDRAGEAVGVASRTPLLEDPGFASLETRFALAINPPPWM